MTNYTKTTNFATKDTLPSGNANKIVKGTEIDTEFNNIATAVATKADTAGPTFTGTVTIPTVDLNGGAIDGTTVGASTAAAITGTTIVANTSINIAGDGATVTGIKDEDDMSSNSATKLATQQSIKAYVDSQVTAQDLDFQADSGGALSIDLDSETLTFTGGTGVDTSGSGNAVTFAIDSTVATLTGTQTLTNKTLTSPTLNTPTIGTSFTIGSATITEAELEILDGATVTTAELNVLDGITSTTAELNILDGVTSTAAELNILDGVTSTTAELNILDGVTSTTAELNILDGVTATTAELNYVDGVTSAIQTQIDAKAPLASPTFTGTVNAAALTVDTTTLVVDATNNRVGIGTSSPSTKLEIRNDVSASTDLDPTAIKLFNNNDGGSAIEFSNGVAAKSKISFGVTSTGAGTNDSYLGFSTGENAGLSEAMRIDSSGNVGIGGTTTTGWANKQLVLDAGSNTSAAFVMVNDTTGRAATDGSVITLSGSDMYLIQRESANMIFRTANTERMRIDSSGTLILSGNGGSTTNSVDISYNGTSGQGSFNADSGTGNTFLTFGTSSSGSLSEAMRIDSSGNVLVDGLSAFGADTITLGTGGFAGIRNTSGSCLELRRDSTDGSILDFQKDGAPVGSIGSEGGDALYIQSGTTSGAGLHMHPTAGNVNPARNGAKVDNAIDLGRSSHRFKDLYATNGTIQTSDRNEKQDIEALSDAEQRVAVACKGLLRKFRWKSSVEENGDDARIHFGIIAQDLQDAFEAEGLDAGRYAMFINSTWTNEETGEERSRMGVRYSELLAFIIAAI
jgi:hypothetical protein